VPVSEAPGNGVAEISQLTGPGAMCFATVLVSLPSGKVNVKFRLEGMNSAVAPSLLVTKAGLQVFASDRPVFTTNVNAPSDPQSAVPDSIFGAFVGAATAVVTGRAASIAAATLTSATRRELCMTKLRSRDRDW
jgi:hypothetical protein